MEGLLLACVLSVGYLCFRFTNSINAIMLSVLQTQLKKYYEGKQKNGFGANTKMHAERP